MFTGIVRAIGELWDVRTAGGARELAIEAAALAGGAWAPGDSVAVAGVCLTVERTGSGLLHVHVSPETAACSTLGALVPGARVNLEPALAAGDALGGHWVTGHVDAVAQIAGAVESSGSLELEVEAPAALARFLAPKGSVALDGVSLTVNQVRGNRFRVNLIPYTRVATTLGAVQPGQVVNLEVDLLARYAARILELRTDRGPDT